MPAIACGSGPLEAVRARWWWWRNEGRRTKINRDLVDDSFKLYFLVPHRFHPESGNSAGFHQNPQEWHWNLQESTGMAPESAGMAPE